MRNRLRSIISEKIFQVLGRNDVYFKLAVLDKKRHMVEPSLELVLPANINFDLKQIVRKFDFNKHEIKNIRFTPAAEKSSNKIEFQIDPQAYVSSLLVPQKYNFKIAEKKNIVVEFSSPNIAKPFHVGHLRSTIIGNVLANLHSQIGHKVTKLNYLGDWGTQFGLLQVGVDMIGVTEEQLQNEPIVTLYRAYVSANQAAKTDERIYEKARQYFEQLENSSNLKLVQQWQQYRKYTIVELEKVYERLGVHFDQYDWESQYSKQQVAAIIQHLEEKSLLLEEPDGRKSVEVNGRRVPIIKSDGTTLYLARDIAALVDRIKRFDLTRILYVVENGQTDHFNACFKTAAALYDEISLDGLVHVKFGKIHGMSTRSGSAVFLRDVLDEASEIMYKKQLDSATTKVDLSLKDCDKRNVADILGVSAVIINDLKQRRQRDYNFNWAKALQVNGDTGIKLQYTHCRLSSLMETMAHIDINNITPNIKHLMEPEAQDLLYELARYDQIIWLATEQLEACVLVNYLFGLCNATSRALKRLNVKNETCFEKQQNRLLLFYAAKNLLKEGMEILGLKPLNKM